MFILLPWENAQEYDQLVVNLKSEYGPKSQTEMILVERMAQHHWLRNRAELLQSNCFHGPVPALPEHPRARLPYLPERPAKAKSRKAQAEIGFESQKRQQEEHTRKQEQHEMKKDRQKWDVLLSEAKLYHQQTLTERLEVLPTAA